MKKLALVLGSLLVVGTAVSAKEVMPAPVAAPEKVVEIVEKPVIVYRDREVTPAWKPNGSVSLKYNWYGEVENKKPKEDKDGDWATSPTNAGRLEAVTNINFTEKQTLYVRTRNYHTLRDDEKQNQNSKIGSDSLRVRHFYNFGTLGDTKVKAKSRLSYDQSGGDLGAKNAEASVAFDFANYFPSNDYFKVTKFALRPRYVYRWKGHGDNATTRNRYELDLETSYKLPLGFSATVTVYSSYDRYRRPFRVGNDGETKKGEFRGALDATLEYSASLYKNDKFELTFDAEGGYDSYSFNQYKRYSNGDTVVLPGSTKKVPKLTNRRAYSVYLLPTLNVSYKATDNVKLFAGAGAEYRNWAVESESVAKNWRWQPTAWAGMKVSF